ncbi:MAG TPA: sigma 54-interacting transcriptional regulator [Pyrinomonadaceae bacterium]|nr:sigma 54-interacting transcriptional regulator [Pyrinomonadaceae bacterium]
MNPQRNPARVLYVEDDPRDADLTQRALARTAPHLLFEIVSSIAEARARLQRLESEPLDLMLTDMHLRDGDGLSLLSYVREESLPLAVVIVTGMGDEETAVAALKARADDYVVKRAGYLDKLPGVLESALNHYQADAARRAHRLNVLYAENNLADIETTRRHLAVHAGHIHVDVVTTASETLSIMQEKSDEYDVLLMDFQLPEPNALDVLRELALRDGNSTPIVLVCNEVDQELARQGLKLGATSFLLKRAGYLYQLPWELEQAHARAALERREAALHESEERNRAILSAIPDTMFLLDRAGTFLDYHTRNEDRLFRPPSEFVGENYADVFPAEIAAAFSRSFAEVLQSDEPVLLEYDLPSPRGPRTFESSMVKCNGNKILAIVRDITERKQGEASLKQALDEVQQLKDQLHQQNIYLQEEILVASNFGQIVGRSEPLRRVLQQAEQVAPLDTTVMILGETGTGKELLAHAMHNLSPRASQALVKVNCAALPGSLIESELFGHEKGAFTGADARRAGRFEIANGGTIFLDEVGELPLDLQAKLLRVLEEGEFERVGGSHTIKVNVRVIAATNRNLQEAVGKGTFRSDLYYRLSIFPITLPPLRDRKEDIPLLVTHLVTQLGQKLGKTIDTVQNETMTKLRNYSWPGNVRELRNVIERAVIITHGTQLRLIDDLAADTFAVHLAEPPAIPNPVAHSETLEQTEYNVILRTLKNVYWKVEGPGGAAELLNINPSTLRSKMRKLRIERPRYNAQP